MSNTYRDLISKLADTLTRQSYSPVVVRNDCTYARDFLTYLAQHEIPITTVTPPQVAQYLRHAAVISEQARHPARARQRARLRRIRRVSVNVD